MSISFTSRGKGLLMPTIAGRPKLDRLSALTTGGSVFRSCRKSVRQFERMATLAISTHTAVYQLPFKAMGLAVTALKSDDKVGSLMRDRIEQFTLEIVLVGKEWQRKLDELPTVVGLTSTASHSARHFNDYIVELASIQGATFRRVAEDRAGLARNFKSRFHVIGYHA